jgi:hypothetical protein
VLQYRRIRPYRPYQIRLARRVSHTSWQTSQYTRWMSQMTEHLGSIIRLGTTSISRLFVGQDRLLSIDYESLEALSSSCRDDMSAFHVFGRSSSNRGAQLLSSESESRSNSSSIYFRFWYKFGTPLCSNRWDIVWCTGWLPVKTGPDGAEKEWYEETWLENWPICIDLL